LNVFNIESHLKPDLENKKELILDIASGLFSKYGFAKTTLDDVADAVGMKKGSLYYYFDSKEAIFSEVIMRIARQILDQMKLDTAGETSPRLMILKAIESGIRRSHDAMKVVGVTAPVKMELMPHAHRMMSDFQAELSAFMSGIIDQGIAIGEFKSCDSKRLAMALHAVVEGAHCSAFHHSSGSLVSDIPLESIIEETRYIIELILDGLRPTATS
jgi:TetR/AcrR family transcriptional regulator